MTGQYEISNVKLLPEYPVVSVQTVTFNHERYIADAIEGVLLQKTSFPVELVIGEDYSTDRTREIVLSYQEKYPQIIRVILASRNVGAMRNALRTAQVCRGKYIAFCDGDDFWTHPEKLQRQVDFLEEHKEYVMCSHAVETVFLGNVKPRDPFVIPLRSATFSEIVDRGWFIPTSSIVSRREAIPEFPGWFVSLRAGDRAYVYMATQSGKNYYFDNIMAVKRKHPGGITQDPALHGRRKELKLKDRIFLYRNLNAWSNCKNRRILYRETAKCCKSMVSTSLRAMAILATVKYACLMIMYTILWKVSRE